MPLPPQRGAFCRPGEKVEYGTHRAHMAMDVQFVPMPVCPFLLFRGGHANPKQVRVGTVDGFDDGFVLLVRKFRLVRRGERFDHDVRVVHFRALLDQREHLFAAAHEETFPAFGVQPFHFHGKQVPTRDAFFGPRLGMNPSACLYDARPVGNQRISIL